MASSRSLVPTLLSMSTLILGSGAASGQQTSDSELERLQDDAVRLVREYIRVNTVNPPGNEARAVEFFARIFDAEGISYEAGESAPGRGNIWARLEGGDAPALLLLHHSDVVPADEEFWSADPLSGVLRDGYVWGRGALDTKTLGIVHLQAFLDLHRSGAELSRDVIFMATADEEAGGFFGAGWLVENRPEVFRDVGLVLNEGGGGELEDGRARFGIEVTQKVPLWLRLVSHGEPGHGSRPPVASAVNRLVRALATIQEHEFEPRIVPSVDAYFRGVAESADDEWAPRFRNMAETVTDREALLELQIEDPSLHALTRNTCSITILEGSSKINVVPPTASAQLDCRLLPDQDPDDFTGLLHTLVNDRRITVERLMAFTPAVSSTETGLYRALEAVTRERFPEATVVPMVQTGFTDSHFFRDLGIDAYGYDPFLIPAEDVSGVHGNDERISVENIRRGVEVMREVLRRVAVAPEPPPD